MAKGIEEIRRLALESEANKAASKKSLQDQERASAQSTANNDMHIWLDAIERAIARKEEKIKLRYDPYTDHKHLRNEALGIAPRLKEWSRFCTHSLEYSRAYAEAVQGLLGSPFIAEVGVFSWKDTFYHWFEIRWDSPG